MRNAGSRGAYGAPRIHAALRRAGRAVNSEKIERLMRKHRIVGITHRRRPGLTRQAKRAGPSPSSRGLVICLRQSHAAGRGQPGGSRTRRDLPRRLRPAGR
ncbi:IS3 family transposase [Streptomyces sp. NPDC050535]|uniref:IS3 family transposase n=1 Tax=Streptomyces sp. NPDC050535 TaxID=3365626 RepID=UPI00379E63D9